MSAITERQLAHAARSQADILREWLADANTKRRLQACTDAAIRRLTHDTILRVPRAEEDRRDGFSRWLRVWRQKLGPAIEEEFRKQFRDIHDHLSAGDVIDMVSETAWPRIEHFLLRYAILGLSGPWVSGKLGDAIILCEPEWTEGVWIVPLRLQDRPGPIGKVVLDRDGTIIPARTSSRNELLKTLHA